MTTLLEPLLLTSYEVPLTNLICSYHSWGTQGKI